MTDEQKRVKIAEAVGWTKVRPWEVDYSEKRFHHLSMLPDYLSDLNAIAEAVASLSDQQKHAYIITLSMMFWPMGWSSWLDTLAIEQATPKQKSDAFLLSLP